MSSPAEQPQFAVTLGKADSRFCPACGQHQPQPRSLGRHSTVFRGMEMTYVMLQCHYCRTEFAVPRVAAPGEWYTDRKEYYGWRWEFDCFLADLDLLRDRATQLNILEIGCGEGVLLQKLQGRAQVWGLELNPKAVRVCESRGIRILPMNLEQFRRQFPDSTFDVVASFQVLEHIENPFSFLRSINNILRPGGSMYCSIPHPHRYQLLLQREQWDYPPHHLTRFSQQGIARLFERAGFDLVKTRNRPLTTDNLRTMRKAFIASLRIPKFFKTILKIPTHMAFHLAARCFSLTGQDYYLAAQRDDRIGSG